MSDEPQCTRRELEGHVLPTWRADTGLHGEGGAGKERRRHGAAAEAAVKVLAPYTWKGVNPYSPQTEDPIDIGDGNVRIIASHCSSV